MEDQDSLPKEGRRGIQRKERSRSMAGTETGEMAGDAELSSPEKSHSTRQELSADQESSSDPATTESPEGAGQVATGVELDHSSTRRGDFTICAEGATPPSEKDRSRSTRRVTFAFNPQERPDEPSDGDNLDAGGSTGQVIEDPSQDSLANVSSPHGSGTGNAAPQEPPTEHSLRASSTAEGDTGAIVETVTRLLEAQRHMIEVQVQALASQSAPPLRKLTGENVNTDDGSIDLWIEQFEE